MAVRHLKAPLGFIDLRHAIASIWGRMYTSGVLAWLTEIEEVNAKKIDTTFELTASRAPKNPEPTTLILEALQSKQLKLFVFLESLGDVLPVPSSAVNDALERTGFLQITAKSAPYRFMDFYPRRVLDDLGVPGLRALKSDSFAFCLKERAFDAWLAGLARRLRWPLDAKRHPRSGRPALDQSIRPVLQDLIVSGRWKQGMPLKSLVELIRSKINGSKIDRETVKRVMDSIYRETGNLAYRYVRRTRRASTKPRSRPA